jgi:6,7-dimethyl-8-ribityllumazine synthase
VSDPVKQAPEGEVSAAGLRVVVVASRFNQELVDRLVSSALEELAEMGLPSDRVPVHRAPGAFELPLLAREVIDRHRPDCVIALGAVVRGETPHFDFVAGEAARGLQSVALDARVPVALGIITANTPEQAVARTRPPLDRGREAARAAVEMVRAVQRLRETTEAR